MIFSKVILKNPEGEGVRDDPISIERVVLLPIDNWSPDFIYPTSNCVKGGNYKQYVNWIHNIDYRERQGVYSEREFGTILQP